MSVAVVTGANRGIGLELVAELIDRGYAVHATCRDPGEAHALTARIAAGPGSVVAMDVADPDSVTAAATTLRRRVGAVDLLVNNAAIGAPPGFPTTAAEGPLAELDGTAILEVLRVNCVGPVLVTQALAPMMLRAGGARVVNVTSDLGSITRTVPPGSYAYAMSKAALNMLTRKLAAELASGHVTVVALHPGSVRTRLGGRSALQSPAGAARRMVDVIDGLTPDANGRAFTQRGVLMNW